jgi:hypothetical protein
MAPVVADDCQYAGRCETEGRDHLTAAPQAVVPRDEANAYPTS